MQRIMIPEIPVQCACLAFNRTGVLVTWGSGAAALVILLAIRPFVRSRPISPHPLLPLRRLAIRQPAQQLRPLLEDLILDPVADAEVRRPLAEDAAGDDEHVILDREVDELIAGQAIGRLGP